MKYLNESNKWGGIAQVTPQEITSNAAYWRDQLYDRKMLVFKGLPSMNMDELWDLHTAFGIPWNAEEYKHSTEKAQSLTPGKDVTVYGNLITKQSIGNRQMPWHRDIPWHRGKRYPIRSLYPVKMTLGAGDTGTIFCDDDVLWNRLSLEDQEMLKKTTVKIHSWYQLQYKVPNPETRIIPLVEIHPHTKRLSILLNSFGPYRADLKYSTAITGTWILECMVDGKPVDLSWIDKLHQIACTPDNIYTHIWETGDLVLFDNYSGVFHGRAKVVAEENAERLFWRMNLKHTWQV